jgi:hypothetical protein
MPTSFSSWMSTTTKRFVKFLFYRTWGGPDQQLFAADHDLRIYRYQRLWDYYQGTAFDDIEAWTKYRSAFGLYRQIRLIWDHVHALVEFYATHVWSGTLPLDGKTLPDGVANAIPLAEDTSDELAGAIGQLWQWWNWQEQMTMLVRYVAALGEYLVELSDDLARGSITLNFCWPGDVVALELDDAGNVKSYALEYETIDEDGTTYRFRREVDQISFRRYRNATMGVMGSFDLIEEIRNPYGFVPAVWFRHIRIMGNHGEPALWATQGELDEVNALFSHIVDKAHITLNAPIIVSGNIAPNVFRKALDDMTSAVKKTFTDDLEAPKSSREELNILEGPAGTNVQTIQLDVVSAAQILDRVIAGIERKVPEVTFYEQLRSMTQLTGPAASRLLGDVEHKVRAIAGQYDRSLIKLLQMGIAMAGFRSRAALDGWSAQTEQQQKFRSFDLDSYKAGDLDFDIMPRELVPMTSSEKYQLLLMKKQAIPALPQEQIAKEGGYNDEQIRAFRIPSADEEAQMREERQEMQTQAIIQPRQPVGAPAGGPQRGSANQSRNGREA